MVAFCAGVGLLGLVVAQPLLILAAAVAAWAAIRTFDGRIRRAEAGRATEQRVGRSLDRLRAGAIVYGVERADRRGDIDVVVLGPWAAAVEVKSGRGRVRFFADGSVRVGRRMLPGRPLRQAVAGAASLRRMLQVPVWVEPVLCIEGMRQRPRQVHMDGHLIRVCNGRHLPRVIRRLERQMTRRDGADLGLGLADPATSASHRAES